MINTRFWADNYIVNLDPTEKLLFLYVLTNHYANIIGVYELPLRNMAFDTGIDKEMIEKIFDRFTKDGKIYYVDGWVAIRNYVKYQYYSSSPKIKTAMTTLLKEIPLKIKEKLYSMDSVYIDYLYSIDTCNSNSNSNNYGSYKEVDVKGKKVMKKV